LRLDALTSDVDEAEVRAEYERQVENFQAAVERHAAHILIETGDGVDDSTARAKLMEIKSRIDNGESFEALAREYSDDIGSSANGGDLGFSRGDVFPEAFETVLAALEPGEVSDPVNTDAGWHLIKLVEVSGSEAPTFEQLRTEIETQLARANAEQRFVTLSEELADLTFNADDLGPASAKLGLPVQRANGVSPEYGEGLFADPRVRRSAFSEEVLAERMNSQPVELASDHVVVLRVVGHEPSRPQHYDEVRDQLFIEILADKKQKFLDSKGQESITALELGEMVDALAQRQNIDWQVVLAATRASLGAAAPGVVQAAFELPPPRQGERLFTNAPLPDGGLAVIEVSNAVDGKLESMADADREQLHSAMQQTRAQHLISAYRTALRQSAEVEFF